jgi:hypothetical protein
LVPEILNAFLWQARLAIRGGMARAFAAHGYVDPSYRPPRLPFVSVVGPMSLQVEPERESPRTGHALLRTPGFVIGQPRNPASTSPASGALRLRFDGRATVTLALAGLPTTPFSNPATGPAIATAIANGLTAALAANQFLEEDGTPVTDVAFLALLPSVAVRWSQELRQLAISSDVGGAPTMLRSTVEVLPTANDLAPALGLSPPAQTGEGRQRLHKLPPPRPMMVEMRLDLWSQTQTDMANMFDGLAYAAPTRGRLTLRPSLLAVDAAGADNSIRLLDRGEPTTLDSLVHLEGGDGLVDRARGAVFTLSGGASSEPTLSRYRVTGNQQISGTVYPQPMVTDPLFASDPAPAGLAVAVGVQIDAGSAQNDSYTILRLTRGNTVVASLAIEVVRITVPNEGQVLFGEIVARAALTSSTAETRWRLRMTTLQTLGTLHATIVPDGAITLSWDGEGQRLDDAQATPVQPTAGVGRPSAGTDMRLVLGGGGGAPALPRGITISHVHVHREPLGPLDPKLRTAVAGAGKLRPGDMIALASSDDGWHVGDARAAALVIETSGNQVFLTKPVGNAFRRGSTLVYMDECFFFQTAVKRRDDLMNRLYHCSVDYRVSALLEDPSTRTTAVLVREAVNELTVRGIGRAAAGHPGVTVVDADPPPGANAN